MSEDLRQSQLNEIDRFIVADVYSTRAEAKRALVDIGIKKVHEEKGMTALPIRKEVKT